MEAIKQLMNRRLILNSLKKSIEIKPNIFGSNKSKQNNILYQNFYDNKQTKSLLKNSLFLILSIFGSNFLINKIRENEEIYEWSHCFESIKYMKIMQIWSKFGLRRTELLFKEDENEDQNQIPASKRFNFIADVTEKVSSALVFIDVVETRISFFHMSITNSSGSGFVVNSSGLILTNAHVIGNSTEVSVKLFDGRVINGKVQYVDYKLDLATVQLDVKEKLPFIKLGDSQKSRTGEWVIALGSPLSLSNTTTVGVISSLNRKIRELDINGNEIDYIQTDAITNDGSSGGPLVNLDGEAIGINSSKLTPGYSFAIPSNYAKEFLERANRFQQKPLRDQMEEKTSNKNRFIGISMLTLPPEFIKELKIRVEGFPDIKNGILILSIALGSPAHLEGLKPLDIITRINGKTVNSANQIFEAFESESTLSLTVRREGKDIDIAVKPQDVND